ncbi:TonB-dependent receptor [Janthinobacterium kumbetense]|uniref:TonB-dependent receptor n=1 Tax=Janthinobacterium kumbetense TaxID=2950280 RepID=A0ABT0WVV6_9BURK|nr:TonB-dependent receptor [Janthinobacterium kumbetense]MCM2568176.1 TonB-dependent receptor [Janthinobacterium kumbetense]
MTAPVLHRRAPAMAPRALVSAISLCFIAAAPAFAQSAGKTLDQIVVTGSRFNSDPALQPIGATVITADEIRRAGVTDVNQAIRKIGGVYGRQGLLGNPDNFTLDLRGFGATASQNMVVVLDGVRLSENELADPLLTTIPIDSVERIEITRGGSSVLYGDGATGGVINIVTKRPGKQAGRGTIFAEAGQLGQREVRGSVVQSWDNVALNAAIGRLETDNYRDNNEYKQNTFSGGAQWSGKDVRAGLRIDSTRQDIRFPGSLTMAQFEANPRQTKTPKDFGSIDSDRYTAFAEGRLGAVDLAAELSRSEKTAKTNFGSPRQAKTKQNQFSPRLRHLGLFDGMLNEIVAGVDFIKWDSDIDSSYSLAKANQKSQAFYVRDELKFAGPKNFRIAAGVRHETFDKDFNDPIGYPTTAYNIKQNFNAWDVQGSFDVVPQVNLYAKAGQSYRVANADENNSTPVANKPLQGQTSHDLELGATYDNSIVKLDARIFRHKLTNEIYYDPTAGESGWGANTNLDPTKHQGIELDASANIAADWRVSGHYQHVKATFTEGVNSGKELTLIPKNTLSARLSWVPKDGQSADIGAQWVDSQRYGSDFANTCAAKIPSFTTFDARYARKFGAWEVAVNALNLTDKQYFTNAYSCKGGIYPSNGRQMKLSARYDF